MAAHVFEEALSLDGGDGRYKLDVDETWEGQPGNIHGGFLLAVILRATGRTASGGRPVSLACQYLRPARTGMPLDIEAVSVRRGRTNELVNVSIRQEGKSTTEAVVRVADPGSGPVCEPKRRPAPVDPLAWPSLLDVYRERGLSLPKFFGHIEVRLGDPGLASVVDSDTCGWVRMGPGITYSDPFLEAARFALPMDSQGATVLRRLGALAGPGGPELPWGFANLDSLVHFHQFPGTDWLCLEGRVSTGSEGFVSAQTQAWSSDGDLLATMMSQVAFFPLPPGWSFLHADQ